MGVTLLTNAQKKDTCLFGIEVDFGAALPGPVSGFRSSLGPPFSVLPATHSTTHNVRGTRENTHGVRRIAPQKKNAPRKRRCFWIKKFTINDNQFELFLTKG